MSTKKTKNTMLQNDQEPTQTETEHALPIVANQPEAESSQPEKAKPFVRRENYCKFNMVESSLGHMLERSVPIKEITANLGISLPTFYKYKNLLSAKNNRLYVSPEEEAFLKKQ